MTPVPAQRVVPRSRTTVVAGGVPQVRSELGRLRRAGWHVLSVTFDGADSWTVTAERDAT